MGTETIPRAAARWEQLAHALDTCATTHDYCATLLAQIICEGVGGQSETLKRHEWTSVSALIDEGPLYLEAIALKIFEITSHIEQALGYSVAARGYPGEETPSKNTSKTKDFYDVYCSFHCAVTNIAGLVSALRNTPPAPPNSPDGKICEGMDFETLMCVYPSELIRLCEWSDECTTIIYQMIF